MVFSTYTGLHLVVMVFSMSQDYTRVIMVFSTSTGLHQVVMVFST